MNILICYGTRPEWLKIKPLLEEFKKNNISFKLFFTQQHDEKIAMDFIYNHTILLEKHKNRLNSIYLSVLQDSVSELFCKFSHILVHGDTTTASACALLGMNNNIPVIHLEAGLRSFDKQNPYPEEYNRNLISKISKIHFCPTKLNADNLSNEGIRENIFIVGNTILDNLVNIKKDIKYKDKILITLHRRENIPLIHKWFYEINEIAKSYSEYEFIFPMHPNQDIQKHKSILSEKNIKLYNPISYDKLIDILKEVKLIITDSGGIQEESCFLNKKCLICRKTTERPECLNLTSFLVYEPNNLKNEFENHINNSYLDVKCPFGDGNSSKLISKILNSF